MTWYVGSNPTFHSSVPLLRPVFMG
jgi:hypothetical protein